jgi:hypothetical protein
MPMISDFKTNMAATKGEAQTTNPSAVVESTDDQNQNLEFADTMHRKLQDLDLMLMKDKGVTTITKLILQFDDRIRGKSNEISVLKTQMPQWKMSQRP